MKRIIFSGLILLTAFPAVGQVTVKELLYSLEQAMTEVKKGGDAGKHGLAASNAGDMKTACADVEESRDHYLAAQAIFEGNLKSLSPDQPNYQPLYDRLTHQRDSMAQLAGNMSAYLSLSCSDIKTQ